MQTVTRFLKTCYGYQFIRELFVIQQKQNCRKDCLYSKKINP
jgi:hypothetical protein